MERLYGLYRTKNGLIAKVHFQVEKDLYLGEIYTKKHGIVSALWNQYGDIVTSSINKKNDWDLLKREHEHELPSLLQ